MRPITLTTDFGTQDWFVGTMKGVILAIELRAIVVDITHDIPPGNIRAGAFALMVSCRSFPRKTIHVAVIDPGVGSRRPAIAVETTNFFFVGPDNGVLSFALMNEKIKAIRRLENDRFFMHPVSQTFHGRDIFAPVAAYLSKGIRPEKLGPGQSDLVRLSWPATRQTRGQVRGEVVYIDRFGNAITNIPRELLAGIGSDDFRLFVRGKHIAGLRQFYQQTPRSQPAGIPGSSGFLEIAVNSGSAAQRLGLKVGDPILLHRTGR